MYQSAPITNKNLRQRSMKKEGERLVLALSFRGSSLRSTGFVALGLWQGSTCCQESLHYLTQDREAKREKEGLVYPTTPFRGMSPMV